MASLQVSNLLSSSRSTTINAALNVPKLPKVRLLFQRKASARDLADQLNLRDGFKKNITVDIPTQKRQRQRQEKDFDVDNINTSTKWKAQLHAILEAVADRVEMHRNIGEQRDNWNSLLLNSINMITLTAATLTGVAATAAGGGGVPLLGLKLSSTLLFSAVTGMLFIMNKIQPSQLAEEQRNATRLFKQLYTQIQTTLALHDHPTQLDVEEAMAKVLALDKAYPLPLLGKMIEKFPKQFEPAVWWPQSKRKMSQELEKDDEMREIIKVMKEKDSEDYMRLGNMALKINKSLAIAGPLLTGIAAAASMFVGNGSWAVVVAVGAAALSSAVNTLEHGGQVGQVVELYRNCAGFFSLLEETIESTELEKKEDREKLEMKVALQLGRSLSDLRNLSKKSASSALEGISIDEFASKLF